MGNDRTDNSIPNRSRDTIAASYHCAAMSEQSLERHSNELIPQKLIRLTGIYQPHPQPESWRRRPSLPGKLPTSPGPVRIALPKDAG